GADWSSLAELRLESRARGVEGFMLKHRDARYGTGRRKQDDLAAGTWWKWKIDPLSIDCVLIYAQAGHGRRASVYTDYTFAVWNRRPIDAEEAAAVVEAIARREPPAEGALQLVPFAKAYSGLTDAEFRVVDRVIRQATIEKFGPVRSVRPSLVFELGFEGINRSTRHKSGIAVRFPRMLRIRDDKPLHEADTMAELEALLALHHADAPGADETVA
ncbi:MAG: ATP-dependent DNA ligase, partial [Caldimonas sp.]